MKNITRYIVTDVVSIPVIRLAGKGEAYKYATGAGWGVVDWYGEVTENDCIGNPITRMVPVNRDRSDKTQVMYCDEDTSAVLYPKYGPEYVIAPYEEINLKDAPKQAETEAIIVSDSCGFTFWAKEGIKIFVTYDENGLIDSYRLDSLNGTPYDGETEISFDDLQSEEDYWKINRADIVGTFDYFRRIEKEDQTGGQTPATPERQEAKEGEEMAGKYKFITYDDRIRIAKSWAIGTRPQDIADEIGVNLATLYRELKRGYPGKDGRNKRPAYDPVIAQRSVDDGMKRRGRKAAAG